MTKILFMIPNLSHGGAEKVLVNLVNNMDRNKFDITVQTLFAGGVNEQFLKKDIKCKYCYKKHLKATAKFCSCFLRRRWQALFNKSRDKGVFYIGIKN
ncbi:MAG: hypothetical protein LUF33_01975 [Clostridiales bacterium]|nr:hypothetical protein [Clostridiales bacterium]